MQLSFLSTIIFIKLHCSNSKVKLEERSYRSDHLAVTDVHSSPADIYRLIAPERGPKRKHPVPVDHGHMEPGDPPICAFP